MDDLGVPYGMESPLWQPICPTAADGSSGGGRWSAIDEWPDRGRLLTGALVTTLGSRGSSAD